jgi:Family of unknown function (DUF6286)
VSDTTLPPAAVPRRPLAVGVAGLLLALALVALGALAVYDAVVLLGWVQGEPVLTPALSREGSVTPGNVTTAVGVVAALLGLVLLWIALRPGRRRGAELEAGTGVWLSWRDVERIATSVAEQQDGVLSASASTSPRTVRVSTRITSGEVEPTVREAVTEALAGLRRPPRVVVNARVTR